MRADDRRGLAYRPRNCDGVLAKICADTSRCARRPSATDRTPPRRQRQRQHRRAAQRIGGEVARERNAPLEACRGKSATGFATATREKAQGARTRVRRGIQWIGRQRPDGNVPL